MSRNDFITIYLFIYFFLHFWCQGHSHIIDLIQLHICNILRHDWYVLIAPIYIHKKQPEMSDSNQYGANNNNFLKVVIEKMTKIDTLC